MELKINDIKGFEPYKADSLGNIYGLKGQVLKPYTRGKKRSYEAVDLYGKTYSVHRLVAYAFGLLDDLYFDGLMIDHINEIKTDNRLENLQVLSNYENIKKSLSGNVHLPKGVSYVSTKGYYKYTIYDGKKYPKGKSIKHSKSLEKILEFVNDEALRKKKEYNKDK